MRILKVKLHDTLYDILLKKCEDSGLNKSDLVRGALMGVNINQKVSPKHSFAMLSAVNKIKNDINKIAINIDGAGGHTLDEINNKLIEFNQQLNQVLNAC